MAERKPVTRKKKSPSKSVGDLQYKEPLRDKVCFVSHSWRDQKTLTVLGDDGIVYVYNRTSNKLSAITKKLVIQ